VPGIQPPNHAATLHPGLFLFSPVGVAVSSTTDETSSTTDETSSTADETSSTTDETSSTTDETSSTTDETSSTTDGTSSTTDETSSTTDETSSMADETPSMADETPSTTDEKLGMAAQVPAVVLIKSKTLLKKVKKVAEVGWEEENVPPLTQAFQVTQNHAPSRGEAVFFFAGRGSRGGGIPLAAGVRRGILTNYRHTLA
jgi:hypothetical protein